MKKRWLIFPISLFLVLLGLAIGQIYHRQYQQVLFEKGTASALVADHSGMAYTMPFTTQLKQLDFDKYPSGKTKQIKATVCFQDRESAQTLTVSVNQPVRYHQFQVYLDDYQTANGQMPVRVHLMYVQQPAQIIVYVGLIALLLACLGWLVITCSRALKHTSTKFWIGILILLTLVTAIIVVMNPMMRHAEVPPILRSVWFLPHVIAYILSYTLLVAAFAFSFAEWVKSDMEKQSYPLFQAGIALYSIGLVLGMLWAKATWGTFWGWDPKESAALITWIVCVTVCHVHHFKKHFAKSWFWMQLLCLLCLLFGWFGVQWLHLGGLHAY